MVLCRKNQYIVRWSRNPAVMGNIHKFHFIFFVLLHLCVHRFKIPDRFEGEGIKLHYGREYEKTILVPRLFSLSSSFHTIDATGIGLDIEHRGSIDGIQSLHVQRTPVASDEVNHTKPDRVGAVGRTRGKHAVLG